MFKVYIDESGIHTDSEMFALAGYLSPVKEWIRFVPKWKATLERHGVSIFHASECNGNRGEFKKFEGHREERNLFVRELLNTISGRNRILALNVGVAVKEFPDHVLRMRPGRGHPYYVGMKSLLAQIALVMDRRFPGREKVKCVFDRQDQFRGKAIDLFHQVLEEDWIGRDKFEGIEFDSMSNAIPLQAADALAFESYREFYRRYYYPERTERPSYAIVTKNLVARPEVIWDQQEAHAMVFAAQSRRS
jgi:hypothetical protein